MRELNIETSRLSLRPPLREDFEAYAAFMADERSAKYVGGVQSRQLAWRGFMTMAGSWQLEGFAMFSVILKSTGEWIGRVGPWMPEGWPGTEVGWGIIPDHWGRGYATEAATASIDWAFGNLGWTDVIHAIHPDNAASIAVAEKLGSKNRGPGKLPDPLDHYDVDIWGQTREEWAARQANARE
jgi:RimJ/RimL family protein N-acetyltransferase